MLYKNALTNKLTKMPEEEKPKEEDKREDSKANTLESIIHESKSLFNLGLAAATPFAFGGSSYFRDALVLSWAQVLGDKTTSIKRGEKYTAADARDSAFVGAALTVPSYHLFNAMSALPLNNTLDYLVKGSLWGGLVYPAFIGFYQAVNYTIKNKKISGVTSYLKENYWNSLKTAWKTIFPLSLLNIFFVPPGLQIPVAALLSYSLSLFGAPKKGEVPEERKKDKTPYLAAASSVVKKTYDAAIKEPFYGLKRIADRINEYISKPAAKPVEQPSS